MTDPVASYVAAVTEAFDPSQLLRELDSISVDQPLAARLLEVIAALDAYHGRTAANVEAVVRSMDPPTPETIAAGEPRGSFDRDELRALSRAEEIRRRVVKLLEPDQDQLGLPAEALAEAFLGMAPLAVRALNPRRSPVPAEQIVQLFLHGAATAGPRAI